MALQPSKFTLRTGSTPTAGQTTTRTPVRSTSISPLRGGGTTTGTTGGVAGFSSRADVPVVPRAEVTGQLPTSEQIARRLRGLLGPFGELFPQTEIQRADIPFLEAGLNFELSQLAEQDRQRAFEELMRGREAIGTSPESQLARELARSRAQQTPFAQEAESARSALGQQLALQQQQALENLQADFARRGLGGGVPAAQTAQLAQQGRISAAQQLADFGLQSALAQEQVQQQALADLQELALEQELRRAAFDEAIARLFAETERAPFDLSGLIEPPPGLGDLAGFASGAFRPPLADARTAGRNLAFNEFF